MKTFATVLVLTISFLSAGAFAGSDVATTPHKANITVVFKNQIGPTKGEIINRICQMNRCYAA